MTVFIDTSALYAVLDSVYRSTLRAPQVYVVDMGHLDALLAFDGDDEESTYLKKKDVPPS